MNTNESVIEEDSQDIEYAQHRVAEVNERAVKAVSQLSGTESNAVPIGHFAWNT